MRGGTPSSSSCYGPTEPGNPQWDWILIQDSIKQPVKWRTTDCVLMEAVYHKWTFAVSTRLYLFVPSLFVHPMFPLMTFFKKKRNFSHSFLLRTFRLLDIILFTYRYLFSDLNYTNYFKQFKYCRSRKIH